MNIKPILIATAVALTSINAYAACTVKYTDCYSGCPYPATQTLSSSGSTLSFVPSVASPYNDSVVFVGWTTNRTGDTLYAPGETISWNLPDGSTCASLSGSRGTITLKGKFREKITVSYNSGGGSGNGPSAPTMCAYDTVCNAPENTYTAPSDDHIFAGWACTHSGNSCGTFLPGASISKAVDYGEITLTAKWTDLVSFKIPTSKSYVDSKTNALQPAFSGLGNNKLMTYGTTDGAVGSRDIVTELGTSTTATTVPTRGAILTGLNTKQNMMFGRSGYVVENVGTTGQVQDKPIYSATNNYENALVDAQTLNNAVIDAVNSELIRVDETGEPNANGTLWKLNDLEHLTLLNTNGGSMAGLNVQTNGTSYCGRTLSGGTNDNNGTCSAATLSTLGSSGNKSGLWGVVMPYGEIVGKSVCSSQIGEYENAATAEQNTALNTDFITQTGNGNLANDQKYCWCKMDSINGEPAVSRWVFLYSTSSAVTYCASGCAVDCGYHVRDLPHFRVGVFGAVAQ